MELKYVFDGDKFEYDVNYSKAKETLAMLLMSDNCYGGDKLWATLKPEQKRILTNTMEHIIGECDLEEQYKEWLEDYFEEDAYDEYLEQRSEY